ncbi:hypothetical protein [Actinomadura hibisca]|uniref:hypothetical protein n=1 Tax=Actinomadura hibisca TaxID=68565 RepID=UPI00082A3C76|nr:hypothetical protein [Actinomadura hibisca]
MRKPLEWPGLFRRGRPEEPVRAGTEQGASEAEPDAEVPEAQAGRPALCYFDARHGPAVEQVTWTPPDEPPCPVRVCAADALRLAEHRAPLDPAFKFLNPLRPSEDRTAR